MEKKVKRVMTPEYLSDRELDAAARMYDIKDKEMQASAVGYMYGVPDRQQAMTLADALPEDKVADSYDYYLCRGLPIDMKLQMFGQLRDQRESIMQEYGLGAIDAVVKRQELEREQDFSKAVAGIPEGLPDDLIR